MFKPILTAMTISILSGSAAFALSTEEIYNYHNSSTNFWDLRNIGTSDSIWVENNLWSTCDYHGLDSIECIASAISAEAWVLGEVNNYVTMRNFMIEHNITSIEGYRLAYRIAQEAARDAKRAIDLALAKEWHQELTTGTDYVDNLGLYGRAYTHNLIIALQNNSVDSIAEFNGINGDNYKKCTSICNGESTTLLGQFNHAWNLVQDVKYGYKDKWTLQQTGSELRPIGDILWDIVTDLGTLPPNLPLTPAALVSTLLNETFEEAQIPVHIDKTLVFNNWSY